MYNTQLRKKGSKGKSVHPGTPRPNPEHFPIRSTDTDVTNPGTDETDHRGRQEKLANIQRCFSNTDEAEASGSGSGRDVDAEINDSNSPKTPNNETIPDLLIWVKHEPFIFGILSPFPCPKIGINILRKVAEYCREKPEHFPELSLSKWSHICKYKILLGSGDLASAYFRMFHILTSSAFTGGNSQNGSANSYGGGDSHPKGYHGERLKGGEGWDVKFHKALKQMDTKDEFRVDTSQFLLFLYIQHFFRLHRKYVVKASAGQANGDEPWSKQTAEVTTGSGQVGNTSAPEEQHVEFVSGFLDDMIDFLMLLNQEYAATKAKAQCESDDGRGTTSSSADRKHRQPSDRVSMDALNALNFILGVATLDTENTLVKEFANFQELLWMNPQLGKELDYRQGNGTVCKRNLMDWVKKKLKINPWGSSSQTITQIPVSVMTGVLEEEADCFKRNKMFWNSQLHPKAWFLISGVERQILHLDSLEVMSSIKINRCIDSHIYIPGVHHMILIQKCHGVHLNLGVTAKVVKIVDCADLTISGIGRLFIICDVANSTFNLLTPSPPIICGNKNHHISLAPYNTSYPNLSSDMKAAGISCRIQKWNKPLEIGSDGFPCSNSADDNESNNGTPAVTVNEVQLVSPENFNVDLFPFRTSHTANTSTAPFPGVVPGAYQMKLIRLVENTEAAKAAFINRILQPTTTTDDDVNLIYQITLLRFKLWLKDSKNIDQIVGLRSLQKSLERKRSSPLGCSQAHDLSCVSMSLRNFFNYCGKNNGSSSSGGRALSAEDPRRGREDRSQEQQRSSSRNPRTGRAS